jgi:hypothetical protein
MGWREYYRFVYVLCRRDGLSRAERIGPKRVRECMHAYLVGWLV